MLAYGSIRGNRGRQLITPAVVDASGRDYALIQLDRVVEGRSPLQITDEPVKLDEPIYVVGHPVGLPKKLASGAKVTANDDAHPYFVANLDTFGGNSGSPVLDDRHQVRGILVRGKTDFVPRNHGACLVAATFPLDRGGEHVCRSREWMSHVPANKLEKIRDIQVPTAPGKWNARNLERLFLEAFTANWQIKRLFAYDEQLLGVLDVVDFEGPRERVVADLVAHLSASRLIGDPLFDRLLEERKQWGKEIEALRLAWVSHRQR